MIFEYCLFDSTPEPDVLNEISDLHKEIFETTDDLGAKMATKSQTIVIIATIGKKS